MESLLRSQLKLALHQTLLYWEWFLIFCPLHKMYTVLQTHFNIMQSSTTTITKYDLITETYISIYRLPLYISQQKIAVLLNQPAQVNTIAIIIIKRRSRKKRKQQLGHVLCFVVVFTLSQVSSPKIAGLSQNLQSVQCTTPSVCTDSV